MDKWILTGWLNGYVGEWGKGELVGSRLEGLLVEKKI